MADFRDFADQLQQDVVTDMAESYFGDRKEVDGMIEAYHQMVEELRKQEPALFQAAARLHTLLLDRQTAREFYIALDIMPSCIPFTDQAARPFFDSLPFAFTRRGRYERCVCRAYAMLQQTADVYLNGQYYDDPDASGRKRLTVHYIRLKALAEYINDRIDKVNKTMSPSETLRYVKKMDVEQSEREKLMGEACMIDGCSLDNDLKFESIDFDKLGLPAIQELPSLGKVKPAIREFCRSIYPKRKHDVAEAMKSLLGGRQQIKSD